MALVSSCAVLALVALHVGAVAAAWGTRVLAGSRVEGLMHLAFNMWALVGPTPDQTYPAEVLYYDRVEPLSSSNQTNWITNNAPQAMLFGTLLQMQSFVKSDARIAVFAQVYEDAMGALKQEDAIRTGDRQAVAVDS